MKMKWIISLVLAAGSFGAEINKLAFMAGCWAGPFGDQVNQEMWMRPAAGTMMGVARNVKGVQTTFTEFMLVNEENGVLGVAIQAKVGGEAVRFPVQSLTGTEVVFENPKHELPRRIIYRAQGKNGLVGRIEGTAGGKAVSEEFPMKRVACR